MAQLSAQLRDIAARLKTKRLVTPQEYAYLLYNDPEAFFAFAITNNPGSLNDILRHRLGYDYELGFTPDTKKLQRICQMILDKDNKAEIQTIWNNFQVDLDKISPDVYAAIKSIK